MHIRTGVTGFLLLGVWSILAGASPLQELEKAVKQERIVFLLVTQAQPAPVGVEAAREMIRQVAGQVENSIVVELDRSDPANADFVAQQRLASAPVPLILVMARNGLVAGGIPAAQATPERVRAMVPSPKKEEILQALRDQKVVFVEVARKGMSAENAVHAACASACGQVTGKSVVVAIDMDDPAEKDFLLAQLKVDVTSTDPVILVINTLGQITGNYKGVTTADELVLASQKRASSGCAPGAACAPGQSCGPTKTK